MEGLIFGILGYLHKRSLLSFFITNKMMENKVFGL